MLHAVGVLRGSSLQLGLQLLLFDLQQLAVGHELIVLLQGLLDRIGAADVDKADQQLHGLEVFFLLAQAVHGDTSFLPLFCMDQMCKIHIFLLYL